MLALRRKRWKMVKLSKIITQVRGVSYKPNDVILEKKAGYTCLLRANNIDRGELKFDDVVYVDSARVKNTQLLRAEDILICASSGSRHLVGKAACVIGDMNVTFGAFCKVIRPLAEYAPFLGWFFRSPRYRMQISNASAGVNINNIRAEDIDNMEIDLLTVKQREEAVRKLNAITRLISLRQRQAEKLDELVKARFVEMFGECKYEGDPLSNVCKLITDGTHQPPQFVDAGIPFLLVSNLVHNEITYDTEKFISKESYQELIKRTPVEIGDILLSIVGSYGHAGVVRTDKPFCFQRHIAYIKPDFSKLNSEFLHQALLSDAVKYQMEKRVKGIAQKTLNLSELKKIVVPIPPLALQTEFSRFVHEVDREKERIQRSAALLETLKRSLMQQYFG